VASHLSVVTSVAPLVLLGWGHYRVFRQGPATAEIVVLSAVMVGYWVGQAEALDGPGAALLRLGAPRLVK
jgi:hypothetical protein